ncbi:pyrroloquinoline quinone biosynthesis protein D [Sinorhizobium kostiense]|uniref:Pyrroloquinoline quinone biosynthesis protein D n=1 Tax=Sinorhizobium kostiense TaxID=76747 RepID=A0ABS4R5G5_9HYPH|nr:pyrroloquinoline quinone biosynthesis peptide chaperone PqqD [Sinorhizobium kostiense]MBP2238137.1 pyrroloquinoline quinone biosynthesis protein D [Sinorhizobium kostiense]
MSDAPEISRTSIVKLARGVRLHKDSARGRMVLLAPERAMAVDDIALAIVEAFDGEHTLSQIAAGFAEKFDAPVTQIANDITAFVHELSIRRMLEIVE